MNRTKKNTTRFVKAYNRPASALLCLILAMPLTLGAVQAGQSPATGPAKPEPNASPASAQKPPAATEGKPAADKPASVAAPGSNRLVQEGIAIEFSIEARDEDAKRSADLIGGENAIVRFKISDTSSGTPVTGLRPAAWLDYREGGQPTPQKDCKEKIRSFLQGSLAARPEIDLNSYFILALNKEPSISVIDPLIGFGTSKLLALVSLNNPGEDWVLNRAGNRLFVTVPLSNQVAVVDTSTWRVLQNVEAGLKPGRIALQKDEKYVWAAEDSAGSGQSGVVAIDAATNKLAARILTGAGRHEIALSTDDRFAFVSNQQDGTLSVVDVQKLAKIKDVKIGKSVTSIAYSPLSKAVYSVDAATGSIVVVDAQNFEVRAQLNLRPGLQAIRFAPGDRLGFVISEQDNRIYVLDTSSNRLLQSVDVPAGPDQIAFTQNYAYVRSTSTDHVTLLPLTGLAKGEGVHPTEIPGGQAAPDKASRIAANAITPAPEGGSVLIANPGDQTIYYYSEGMAAPMGNFQNYRREPRAVLVVDRSIRETALGTYSANIKLPPGGAYDMAFLLDSPRVANCFDVRVKPNPALEKQYPDQPLEVQYLVEDTKIQTGKKANVRFKLIDRVTGTVKNGLEDVRVLTFLASGAWQERQWAAPVGNGVYEISFVPPEAGVYYVFLQCESLKIKLNQLPYIILDGRDYRPESAKPGDKPGESDK